MLSRDRPTRRPPAQLVQRNLDPLLGKEYVCFRDPTMCSLERALRLRGASEDLKESSGGRPPAKFVDLPDPRGTLRGAVSDQQIDEEWERGKTMTLDEVLLYAGYEGP